MQGKTSAPGPTVPSVSMRNQDSAGPGPGQPDPAAAPPCHAGGRGLPRRGLGAVAALLLAAALPRRAAAAPPAPSPAPAAAPPASPARATERTRRAAPSRPLVMLDPGHGGRDPGAIGKAGTQEKRIVLAAALELKRQLERGGRCRVAMTRARDVFVPLGARIDLARKRQAVLFLSLHADSAPGARGASVYTLAETASDALAAGLARRENGADAAGGLALPSVPPEVQRILISLIRRETRSGSERLAKLTVAALKEEVALLPNTHRRAGFVVLKAPDVPAALVEMGFLSHPADEAALRQPAHRARLAKALAQAVHGFLATRQAEAGETTPG